MNFRFFIKSHSIITEHFLITFQPTTPCDIEIF